jgi:hypothetical protein
MISTMLERCHRPRQIARKSVAFVWTEVTDEDQTTTTVTNLAAVYTRTMHTRK